MGVALFLALAGLVMAIYLVSMRDSERSHLELTREATMAAANKGIVDRPSSHTVEQTVERLKGILQAKGVSLFAVIDHSGEAEKAGMTMRPTKLLFFGSPMAGTPLMLAAPSRAVRSGGR